MFTTVHGEGKPISFFIPFIIIIILYNLINRKKDYDKMQDKASMNLKILIAMFPPYGLYKYFREKGKFPKKGEEIKAFLIYGLFLWMTLTFISFLLEMMV